MTRFKRIHNYLLIGILFSSLSLLGQESESLWKSSSLIKAVKSKDIDWNTLPKSYRVYELSETSIQNTIKKNSVVGAKNSTTKFQMSFPNAHGEMELFEVEERSIFAPELQAKYPNIKSFIGQSVENPQKQVRFSASDYGVNAVIFDKNEGSFYIDKINNSKGYLAYQRKHTTAQKMQCLVEEKVTQAAKNQLQAKGTTPDDGILRTYRLAIATTGEYSQYHITDRGINADAEDSVKIEAVLDAINVAMTRVNGIFERDVAITMELVAENDQLIFLDPETDNLSNNDVNELIDESQYYIDLTIGTDAYDIGHTFSTGAGGLAQVAGPCDARYKAKGVTGISAPKGDAFYVDFVAHEMGHQYGANHTFNGTTGNCAGSNRHIPTAIEPGSGTTIMSYAGICAPQNVQDYADDYFHLVSIREMWANISGGTSSACAQLTSTGNTAPEIEELKDHTIPISTPFALGVKAIDAEGDILTYTWEQLDNETASVPLVSTETGGPAFRSLPPSESPVRYFPSLETTLEGKTNTQWEVLPSVERTMNFGVNVRDNNSEVGQTATDESFLTVSAEAGPFVVTSQNTPENWDAGTTQTVTWDVANTNVDPVNCKFVNILLSHDGGVTFSEILAESVENDGSHNVVAPGITTSRARIMIQSVENVFFAVNTTEFSIQDSEFVMEFETINQEICVVESTSFNFTFKTFLGFSENTTFSATGNPDGTTVVFDPSTASVNGTTVQMTIQGITDDHVGSYEISVTGTSNSVTKSTVVYLDIFSASIAQPILSVPTNGEEKIKKPYILEWNADANVHNYIVEIASDNGFANILETSNVEDSQYEAQSVTVNGEYYWRVKGQNNCGESDFSEVFNFTTENEVCNQYAFGSAPLDIPDASDTGEVTTVSAEIVVTDNVLISDLNVGITIDHSYVGDLRLILHDPHGNAVRLVSNSDNSGNAYTNTIFDSDSDISITSGISPYTGTYAPEGDLSLFDNLYSRGIWTLDISDHVADDIGELVNFELTICGVPVDSNDFSIETTSVTCPGSNDGIVKITAPEVGNYTAEFDGQTYDFTSSYTIEDVTPGDYRMCVSDDMGFVQCFNLLIEDGVNLLAKSSLKAKQLEIEIESGTAPFKVFKNDVLAFESSSRFIEVDVAHGDVVTVSSKEACEGVYAKSINLFDYVSLYPNPSQAFFNISIPSDESDVQIEIYSSAGQLISSKNMEVKQHKVVVESAFLPQGLYFVKVGLQEPQVFKFIKQ